MEIYTVKQNGKAKYDINARDIEDARRYVYWHESAGQFEIWKGKRLMGMMYRGAYWWGYDPNTGYGRSYTVLCNGVLRDDEWEVR